MAKTADVNENGSFCEKHENMEALELRSTKQSSENDWTTITCLCFSLVTFNRSQIQIVSRLTSM